MSEPGCVRTFAFWCLTETVGEAGRKHFDNVNMAVAVKQCHSTFYLLQWYIEIELKKSKFLMFWELKKGYRPSLFLSNAAAEKVCGLA